jgi:hypothetical protein
MSSMVRRTMRLTRLGVQQHQEAGELPPTQEELNGRLEAVWDLGATSEVRRQHWRPSMPDALETSAATIRP